ncbi:MAG: T9SS type A sorting domain-containing protein [Candidatus Cloacimonetes bacterium]|nr:T9SS type A sorting domain-containing protein [Candidatus Cloacimonadota bacterium]
MPPIILSGSTVSPTIDLSFASSVSNLTIPIKVLDQPDHPLPIPANCGAALIIDLPAGNTTTINFTFGSGFTPTELVHWNGTNWVEITATSLGIGSVAFDWTSSGRGEEQFVVNNGNDTTLPVELSSFTAVISADNQVVINWTTQSETNVLGFRIYRNNTFNMDESILITPQYIPAHNSSITTDYSFTDTNIDFQSPIYYYWLESVDLDSSSEFFGPVMVSFGSFYLEMQNLNTELINHQTPELSWTTNSESSLLVGFEVYRSEIRNFGSAIKVNDNPIYSLNLDFDHTYSFNDESVSVGENYFYWIAGLSWDGIVTLHGPIEVFLPNLEILAFSAEVRQCNIVVGWQSEFELELSGFRLFRSLAEEDAYELVSNEFIPAENNITGSIYSYIDETAQKNKNYKYKLLSINRNEKNQQFYSNLVEFPFTLSLSGNYPNPFNPSTNIKFELAEQAFGSLEIFNLKGQIIQSWDISGYGKGENTIIWNGTDLNNNRVSSGVYLYRLSSGGVNLYRKMLLLK